MQWDAALPPPPAAANFLGPAGAAAGRRRGRAAAAGAGCSPLLDGDVAAFERFGAALGARERLVQFATSVLRRSLNSLTLDTLTRATLAVCRECGVGLRAIQTVHAAATGRSSSSRHHHSHGKDGGRGGGGSSSSSRDFQGDDAAGGEGAAAPPASSRAARRAVLELARPPIHWQLCFSNKARVTVFAPKVMRQFCS